MKGFHSAIQQNNTILQYNTIIIITKYKLFAKNTLKIYNTKNIVYHGDNIKPAKIPTCIESLDTILHGGLPRGSLTLLLEDGGAGGFEFAITTAAQTLQKNTRTPGEESIVPEKVCYITFTRSKEDIMNEIALSFQKHHAIIEEKMKQSRIEFKEFSEAYFASSFIPTRWRNRSKGEPSLRSLKWSEEEENLIEALIEYLDKNADSSLIIIDSLTALVQYSLQHMKWNDLILFLYGIQRASKDWKGLIYTLLNRNICNRRKQEEIADCTDGVIVFKWNDPGGSTQRERIMQIEKLRGVLPTLYHENIANFEIQITPQKGFEISNIKRVRGRV
ncbi:KaiC [Candidatus Methanoperedenaceae archaeon GB50]|nr:KaiC [Candidatus Methanoperedenaceae archaeon GB50]CAD7778810.1 MAG: KaiC [Candidatus Methanoperedenaceae archaeon GB50]